MSKKDRRNRKNTSKKGRAKGLVTGGITAVVLASIFQPFRIFEIALLGGVAYLIGKIVSVMASGLDLTTHNKQDKPMKELETIPKSGDDSADGVIARGQEMLRQIREANDAIPDPKLSQQMYELERLCVQIFKTVSEQPSKAPQIRKFMNYYLPTTLKMLGSYRIMQERGVSRAELSEAHKTLVRGMDMVLTACQKLLDSLFKAEMLDVSTDIDVLEQMLRRDGFTEELLAKAAEEAQRAAQTKATPAADATHAANAAPRPSPAPHEEHTAPRINVQARTAASAQTGSGAVPTLETLTDDQSEEFISYYHQKERQ